MSLKKFTDLAAAANLALTDVIALVQGGVTKRGTWQQVINDIILPSYAEMYIAVGDEVATTVAESDTWYKVAGVTTLATNLTAKRFTHTNNRLTYTGTPTIGTLGLVSISFTTSGNQRQVHFRLAKGGVIIDSSECHRTKAAGADRGFAGVQALFSLATSNFAELWVLNEAAADVTVEHMNLITFGFRIPSA